MLMRLRYVCRVTVLACHFSNYVVIKGAKSWSLSPESG